MDGRGPVTGQRVAMVPGMQGLVPHNMGPNAPPPVRPVTPGFYSHVNQLFCFLMHPSCRWARSVLFGRQTVKINFTKTMYSQKNDRSATILRKTKEKTQLTVETSQFKHHTESWTSH